MKSLMVPRLQRIMAGASPLIFVLATGLIAFSAYGCVYALRKPFTAASFVGMQIGGVQYKIALVIAQVAGYALSKFVGIRMIAALGANRRAYTLLLLSSVASISLLGFALASPVWGIFWMFVNGFPLGMAWGVVFGYLEGRRVTELLAAMLCINFILSSAWVKTVGKWVMLEHQVSEHWMPFVVAMIFFPILLLCIWLLEHIPHPSEADRAARQERQPMSKMDQNRLLKKYAPGLVMLTLVYLLLTIIRDVRDNFAVELWSEMGMGGQAGILTSAEIPIAVLVLSCIGALSVIRNNRMALWINHAVIMLGALMALLTTWLFHQQLLTPWWWMMLSGTGIFGAYILFNGVIFDRLLAAFKEQGNVGFLMYIADAIGYLGSVSALLWRNFGQTQLSWVEFFGQLCWIGGIGIMVLTAFSWWYFHRRFNLIQG